MIRRPRPTDATELRHWVVYHVMNGTITRYPINKMAGRFGFSVSDLDLFLDVREVGTVGPERETIFWYYGSFECVEIDHKMNMFPLMYIRNIWGGSSRNDRHDWNWGP